MTTLRPVRNSRESLSSQAAASLRVAIQEGRWEVGSRLPSEAELATDLGISRPTLREAIRLLISDGMLDRRPGVGTFVRRIPAPSIERGIDELFSLSEAIEEQGYRESSRACTAQLEPATEHIADELRLEADDVLWRVRRVRLADGSPVIVCDDYIPTALVPPSIGADALRDQILERHSLYAWLEQRLGLSLESASVRVMPVVADDELSRDLDLPAGAPLLRLEQTHYAADGRPVLYSVNTHDCNVIHFRLERRRMTRSE